MAMVVDPTHPGRARGQYGERFHRVAEDQAAEDTYDLAGHRAESGQRLSGVSNSVMNLIKGALGAGILSSHVAYKESGAIVGLILNALLGIYMTYCLYILGISSQILCKRTNIPILSYSEVGEASMALHSKPMFKRLAKCFRISIDVIICIDLFGCCSCYQLVIAKTIKQLVENVQITKVAAEYPGYPNLRIYLLMIMIPCACVCLIRHLDFLAPLSVFGNLIVALCVVVTIYYCFKINPSLSGVPASNTFEGTIKFLGMIVFSMSCSGIVVAVETNMKRPSQFGLALNIGMFFIVVLIMVCAFFGYAAYKELSQPPITLNFPMEALPSILKVGIALMIYITHAVNYWVPFNLAFHYLRKMHKPEKQIWWEYFYRGTISMLITLMAIVFPDIGKLMGFLGSFCVSNMAFIWPNMIYLFVFSEYPGLGAYYWRLWKCIVLILIGAVLWAAGTLISIADLKDLVGASAEMIDEMDSVIQAMNRAKMRTSTTPKSLRILVTRVRNATIG